MEILVAVTIGTLVACGVFLLLRPQGFTVVLGLTLLSHAINLLLVSVGRVRAPDPLAQALVLTAIVISFGMTAFLLVLAYRGYQRGRTERVDLEAGHH